MSGDSVAETGVTIDPGTVLAFWRAAGPDKWFDKDAAFDAEVAKRFLAVWHAAVEGRLESWEAAPEGALALTIVLDQFPRNMFRGDARTYATDRIALAVADGALRRGFDRQVPYSERQFSTCRSCTRKILPTSNGASSWLAAMPTLNSCNMPNNMRTSFAGSAAFPIAIARWAAPRPRTSRTFSTPVALRADEHASRCRLHRRGVPPGNDYRTAHISAIPKH